MRLYGCKYIGNSFSARSKSNFDGVGPRLGLTGDTPLFGPFFLTGSVSGSLLWGDHQVRLRSSGFYPGGSSKFSDSGMVTNAEGELGVGLPFFATGGTLVFGARWEGWFDQTKFKNYKVDLALRLRLPGLSRRVSTAGGRSTATIGARSCG